MDTELGSYVWGNLNNNLPSIIDHRRALTQAAAAAVVAMVPSSMQQDQQQQRLLVNSIDATAVPTWKAALWDSNSVEPAMLRPPFVIVMFIFLWGFNVLFFEKIRLQYYGALNIKTG